MRFRNRAAGEAAATGVVTPQELRIAHGGVCAHCHIPVIGLHFFQEGYGD
jgi:hypothetical protein